MESKNGVWLTKEEVSVAIIGASLGWKFRDEDLVRKLYSPDWKPRYNQNGMDLARILADSSVTHALVDLCERALSGELITADVYLTSRERKVLELRFGFETHVGGLRRTLEEVSRDFSLTRERIRQNEAVALRKLRTFARVVAEELQLPS